MLMIQTIKQMDIVPVLFIVGGVCYMLLIWLSSKHEISSFARIVTAIMSILVVVEKPLVRFLYGADLASITAQKANLDPIRDRMQYEQLARDFEFLIGQCWRIRMMIYYTVIVLAVLGIANMLMTVIKHRGKIFVFKGKW